MLTILFFGDVVGRPGRRALALAVPQLRREAQADLVIANVENIAHGKGITAETLTEVRAAGVDICTSGNHILDRPEALPLLQDPAVPLLRPLNYGAAFPGRGFLVHQIGSTPVLVANLAGQVFMKHPETENPFTAALDAVTAAAEQAHTRVSIVDFHAEATSEKVAFGVAADGRVSAVLGSHTHVPTADARILPGGTAHVSDVGMVGARDSIIGGSAEPILASFREGTPLVVDVPAGGVVSVNYAVVEIDETTGRAVTVRRETKEVTV